MNQQTTPLAGLQAILTAHRDQDGGLLLVSLSVPEAVDEAPRSPLKVALVIDRSGSMGGDKLDITKAAVAQFIRTLEPDDRVAVVTYDDQVNLLCGLEAPSESLAKRVEALQTGGSTDLYGGWVMGAKVVGSGGRVILLSDGQANVGRFTEATELAQHAGISFRRFGVTTTTIGVGNDYDEALMAGMARSGSGAHYFAHTTQAISDAFSQERYSAGAVAIGSVSVRCGAITEQFGHFWAGETKKRVFPISDVSNLQITVRYTTKPGEKVLTEALLVPNEFGYSEEVRLERLLQRASEAEADMLRVRDPRSATTMRETLRSVVLALLGHPSSDDPAIVAVVDRLKASIERLESLERNYVEEDAMMHRKRSMQSSHNLRERAQAFSSFEEEKAYIMAQSAQADASSTWKGKLTLSLDALALVPLEEWIRWEALPLEISGKTLVVALENPRSGFQIHEIEKRTGYRVKPVFAGIPTDEIIRILKGG